MLKKKEIMTVLDFCNIKYNKKAKKQELITLLRTDKDLIEKYIDWDHISVYQTLSEDFIREFQDKWNWSYISTYQERRFH